MTPAGTEILLLVLTSKTVQAVEHRNTQSILFVIFCHKEDILRKVLGLISDSRHKRFKRFDFSSILARLNQFK